jgi:RNA polymerase sigma-70 factor (ECF subfamily)
MKVSEHISDFDLVRCLQNEDLEAFDLIFRKYSKRLYAFALHYLKTNEEAEEIVQDVFLKIWENRKKLKQESSFKSYLFTIAYHDICKHFRKRVYNINLKKEISESSEQTFSLDEQISYQSVLEQVDAIVNKLPSKQKAAFIKSRKEGKSSREIAEEMRLAPGTVDNLISDALKFIRKNIGRNVSLLLYFSVFIGQ